MNIETYERKSFPVSAVQVTKENLSEVAKWCGGEVQTKTTEIKNATKIEDFVQVPVKNPLNEKQTRAFIGDWVLDHEGNFKVYTDRAFLKSFQKVTVYTEAQALAHLEDPDFPVGHVVYTEADAKDQLVDYDDADEIKKNLV